MDPSERRQHPRLSVKVEIDFTSDHNFYSATTRDVSVGGVFLETNLALKIGTKIEIELKFLKRRAKIEGEIAWQLMEGDEVVGVGVRFGHVPAAAEKSIRAFMALRDPLVFGDDSIAPPRLE